MYILMFDYLLSYLKGVTTYANTSHFILFMKKHWLFPEDAYEALFILYYRYFRHFIYAGV